MDAQPAIAPPAMIRHMHDAPTCAAKKGNALKVRLRVPLCILNKMVLAIHFYGKTSEVCFIEHHKIQPLLPARRQRTP